MRLPLALRRLVALWLLFPALSASGTELRDILDTLSRKHGFTLEGRENLTTDQGAEDLPDAELSARVRYLLQRYNYLLVSGDSKPIEKIVIIGAKPEGAVAAADPSVRIRRDGPHHRVDAVLRGVGGREVTTSLIIDTGASNVVLPRSMIEPLGFREQDLTQTRSQTASGSVPVRVGTLSAVRVGGNEAREVSVSFVDDRRLGDLRLLGMSFLGRFQVTIDDRSQRLILVDR